MNKVQMLSFRLDAALLHKVDILRISRHRTRGEIIREALEMYFRAHNPLIREATCLASLASSNTETSLCE